MRTYQYITKDSNPPVTVITAVDDDNKQYPVSFTNPAKQALWLPALTPDPSIPLKGGEKERGYIQLDMEPGVLFDGEADIEVRGNVVLEHWECLFEEEDGKYDLIIETNELEGDIYIGKEARLIDTPYSFNGSIKLGVADFMGDNLVNGTLVADGGVHFAEGTLEGNIKVNGALVMYIASIYGNVCIEYGNRFSTYEEIQGNNTRRMMRAVRNGGVIKSFTVSQVADRWYVSFLVETTVPAPSPTRKQGSAGAVGVDLGVKYMAALSDTNAPKRFNPDSGVNFTNETNPTVENPRWLKRTEKRITKLQQKIARQVKGSNRRKATVRKLAKTHHLVALRRETGLHQLTKNLTTRYALIGIEDLNVSGMTASASGTVENPGKNVAQKAGLNRAVLDVSFGMFRTQLEYKAAWYGSAVQVIDRYYPSSQTCSNCGKRPKTKLTLSDRVYKCGHCNTEIDRDLNAAINIRREAERLYAEA